MIDNKILSDYASDNLALRALFQVQPESDDSPELDKAFDAYAARFMPFVYDRDEEKEKFRVRLLDARTKWEKRISERVDEGRLRNFQSYRWYYAADLAGDGPAFSEQVPLMLYAQGKIDVKQCSEQLKKSLGDDRAKEYLEFDDRDGVAAVNVVRLGENVINLVRPYITRRKAALSNKYGSFYPWLKYESRSKTMIDKVKAEVLTQRIEMVTDMQGYRHELTQWINNMLYYGGQLVFVRNPWVKEYAIMSDGDGQKTVLLKEGTQFSAPHPTRIFYDRIHPPASINTDNGCTYLGYWDVTRYGEILYNPSYFNTSAIRYSGELDDSFGNYRDFFQAYYGDSTVIKFVPTVDKLNAMVNDRKAQSGIYSHADRDCSVYLTHYYERVIPRDVGFGHYPFPVWVKLTVANDKTVILATILPSRPAFYMGYNENDSRIINPSMAHEIIPYQDQAQTLLSQLYYLMRIEQLIIAAIDVDVITDPNMRKHIKEYLKGKKTRFEAFYFEWSPAVTRNATNSDPSRPPVQFLTSQVQSQINTCLEGIKKTLELLERNLLMAPQELGQFVERETSATENMIVEKTTNALHSFTAEGVDEARAAMKQILYESFVAYGEDGIETPVTAAFPREYVEKAGFEFYDDDEEQEPEGRKVVATKAKMPFPFIYNSRDGSERTVSVEAAKALYQFVAQIMQSDKLINLFGWKQISEMIGEVFRISGSSFVIKLPDNLPEKPQMPQENQQPAADAQAIVQQVTALTQEVQALKITDQQFQQQLSQIMNQMTQV